MSILLIGGQGQVGQELTSTLTPLANAFGPLHTTDRSQLDLTDLEAIAQLIGDLSPQLIVNAAAYTVVDKAESEPDLAHRINAEAPGAMAKAAKRCGAKLVHISTDYVFSGQESTPRQETDPTGPISVYGQTKLAGEAAIRAELDEHIILRTAWVYGTYGKGNFVKTMLRLGVGRSELNVVADQIGTPTWARDIAIAISQLSQQIEGSGESPFGTFHFSNSQGPTNWHAFATAIFDGARSLGLPLDIETVNPITTAEYPTPAQRPPYSVLDCSKIAARLGQPPAWQDSLQAMLAEYVPTLLAQASAQVPA